MFILLDSKDEDTRRQLILSNAEQRKSDLGLYTAYSNPKPRPRPVPPEKSYRKYSLLKHPTWAVVRSKVINDPESIIKKHTFSSSLNIFDNSDDETVNIARDLFCMMTAGMWLALDPDQLKYKRHPNAPLTLKAAIRMWSFAFCQHHLIRYVLRPRVSTALNKLILICYMICLR
jgi:hypothetical protein